MIGHTAFLITARRLAPGVVSPLRQRRPAKTVELEAAFASDAATEPTAEVTPRLLP